MTQQFDYAANDPVGALARAWQAANPHVTRGPPLPPPCETQSMIAGSCVRTVPAGGGFAKAVLHPSFVPFEHVFRKLPQDGVYEATRQNPFQFEMGAFTVPRGMNFVLAEYEFQIFRLNGAVAGDAVPLEDRRLPLQVGYDMSIDQFQKGDIQIEILPIDPSVVDTQAAQGVVTPPSVDFQPPQVTFPQQVTPGGTVLPNVYGAPGAPGTTPTAASAGVAVQTAKSHIDAAAAGSALLPQEQKVQGPHTFPFTYILKANQAAQLKVVVFSPIRIPIAFFESRLLGYVVPKNAMEALLKGINPCW
jgi:hypothetical protein